MTRALEVEIYVDSFAGGGGASKGMELALGRGPDVAINHDAEAIALHAANHPETEHYQEDVWKVDPVKACRGRPVGVMWLSPDCKHFSKAKGGKPVSKRVRGLAWVAVRWAVAVKPRIIVLENVEEFQTWGPVSRETMRPDPARKGHTFKRFVGRLRTLGYVVEWRELRACDYGAPTIRKRLFLIARCDGRAIVWPTPTHGKGRPHAWRTAAEVIDFSHDCPSIFARKKPLAENTLKRIAAGLRRFVFESQRPFIVEVQNSTWGGKPISIDTPFRTITAHPKGGGHALVEPYLVEYHSAKRDGDDRVKAVNAPLPTQDVSNRFGLVAAFLARHYTERKPGEVQGVSLFGPMPTVTTIDHNALVTAHLSDVQTHAADVRAFLVAYFGNEKDGGSLFDPVRTVTSRDRFGLVTVAGVDYQLADIGMRMLQPRELYRAQGFPDSYKIDIPFTNPATGKTAPMTKTAQVRMCGNSVCPDVAAAILTVNVERQVAVVEAA